MSMIAELIIRWTVPFVLGGIVGTLSAAYGKRKAQKEQDAVRDNNIASGVQCLLRADIIRSAEKYHDKGFCPVYARESLTREYNSYHNLGGNDVATELFHRTISLPTDPEKEDK